MSMLMIILIIIFVVILLIVLSNFIAKIVTMKRVEVTDKSIDECIEVIVELKKEVNELKQQISVNNEKMCEFEETYLARRDYVDKQLEYFADDLDQLSIVLEEQKVNDFNNKHHHFNPTEIEDLLTEKKSLIARVDEVKQQMESLQNVTDKRQRLMFKQELNAQMQKIKTAVEDYQQKERNILDKLITENE